MRDNTFTYHASRSSRFWPYDGTDVDIDNTYDVMQIYT